MTLNAVLILLTQDITYDWLTTEIEGEKFTVSLSKDEVTDVEWNTLLIPNPFEYLNNNLYFGGHLDNDMVLPTLSMGELTSTNSSDNLVTKLTI